MDGKTHAAVGVAAAFLFVQPKAPTDLVIAAGVGAFAGILPDIDIKRSEVATLMKKVVAVFIVGMTLLIVQQEFTGLTITQRLNQYGIGGSVVGLAILIAFCAYGSTQSHRGFTHSLAALAVMTINSYFLFGGFLPAFVVGYLSHLVADIFNTKGEQFLWPLPQRYRLSLCASNKTAALTLRMVAYVLSVGYALSLPFGETALVIIKRILG